MRLSESYFLEGYPRRTEGKHCRLPTHRRNLPIESERMPAYCANQKMSRHSGPRLLVYEDNVGFFQKKLLILSVTTQWCSNLDDAIEYKSI